MNTRKQHLTYDLFLILATIAVLCIICFICMYGMVHFKAARIQLLPAPQKLLYLNHMNRLVAPFVIGLVFLIGICIPRRLLSDRRLMWANAGFIVLIFACGVWSGIRAALMVTLLVSLMLQSVVLVLAIAGSSRLKFETRNYWVRVGSCLIHLGLVLFVLDILSHNRPGLHTVLFVLTTVSSMVGMLLCFYAGPLADFLKLRREPNSGQSLDPCSENLTQKD